MTVDPTAATAAEPGREGRGPASGDSLGKYRLERVLGAGGMGIVWAAFDPDLERAVAIKVLRAADSDEVLRARLLREARAMARLKHPNVLTVYEVGTVQNRDYIAMELVDGDNMDAWLATRPPREQVIDALLAAGRGLAAAHAAGLVHRDFKPQNVLRSRDGHVYVTDFGLARGQIEDGSEVEQVAVAALPDELATESQYPRRALDSILDSPLTQTGVLIGTPAYMAPEQFAGRPPDARTDQFAFCVTAWEALTGARPFRGASLRELEAAVGTGVPAGAGAASGPPGPALLPPRAREVLVRGLDPSPAARWPDLPALLAALAQALAPEPAEPAGRGAGRPWLIAAGLGAIAAAAMGAVMVFDLGGERSALGDDCDAPEEAFDPAWSAERRAAFVERRGKGEVLPAVAILDRVRHQWVDELRKTCREEPSEARTRQLACLRDARARVARKVRSLQGGSGPLQLSAVIPLATSLAMCTVGHDRPVFPGGEGDEDATAEELRRAAEAAALAAERAHEHAEQVTDRLRDKERDAEGDKALDEGPRARPEGAVPGLGLSTGDPDLDRYIRRQIRKHAAPAPPRGGSSPGAPAIPEPPEAPEPPAPTEPDPDSN